MKYEGFVELEEGRRHDNWERDRFFTTVLRNMWAARGKKITPQQLCRFDWENESKKGKPTPKRDRKRFEYWAKKWGGKLPEKIIDEAGD